MTAGGVMNPQLYNHLLAQGWSPSSDEQMRQLDKRIPGPQQEGASVAFAQARNGGAAPSPYPQGIELTNKDRVEAILAQLKQEGPATVDKDRLSGFQVAATYQAVASEIMDEQLRDIALAGPNEFKTVDLQGQMLALRALQRLRMNDGSAPPLATLPPDAFLRKSFVEQFLIRLIGPRLMFLSMGIRRTVDAKNVTWFKEDFSPDTDPKLGGPRFIRPGTKFPRTSVSDPIVRHASIGMLGSSFEITRDAIRFTNPSLDDLQRQLQVVAFSMAAEINAVMANELANDFDVTQAGFEDRDKVLVEVADVLWDDPQFNPLEDIFDAVEKMETNQSHYEVPTRLLLNPHEYRRLKEYLVTADFEWVRDPQTGVIRTQIDDVTIVKAAQNGGIPDGFGLMLAEGPDVIPPLTIYDAVDPEFSRTGILHVQQFRDNETNNVVTKYWKEFVAVNKNPDAVVMMKLN